MPVVKTQRFLEVPRNPEIPNDWGYRWGYAIKATKNGTPKMALSDVKCRQTKPAEKINRLHDTEGLYLEVRPNGSKLWRFKYRIDGKEKLLALGKYPVVSLVEAREARAKARKLVKAGIDPVAAKRDSEAEHAAVTQDTFEVIGRQWHMKKSAKWAEGHSKRVLQRLEGDVFPTIGKRPIRELKAPEILAMLQKIEARGSVETAHRVRRMISQTFRYAIAAGRADGDPAAALSDALADYSNNNFNAVLEPTRIGQVLRTFAAYNGSETNRALLNICPYLVARPGELRKMKWSDLDMAAAVWNLTLSKSKSGSKSRLLQKPIPHQAMVILEDQYSRYGQASEYVFPQTRKLDRPASENAMRAALIGMELESEITMHGWRAVFRTLGAEIHDFRVDCMEMEIGHVVKDSNGDSYNRTKFFDKRREMMQLWADYLEKLQKGPKGHELQLVRTELMESA